ncbi:MAG: DUF1579 domain-containing protein [Fimbriimonadaceae bacterium]|nr:DUF1579 domain-containing protein [Chitinophagales bacterium]
MKKILAFTLTCIITTNYLFAQQPSDAETQKWMAYMTPGEEHKMMKAAEGEWKAKTKMWMDPTQPPMESESKVKCEMILGGRYLSQEFNGSMMGMPFNGMGIIGYDNAAKKYVGTWIDNMGTGVFYQEGNMKSNNTLEMVGMMVDPMTGKDMKVKTIYTFMDDKTEKMEMYNVVDGKEIKAMEMIMTKM